MALRLVEITLPDEQRADFVDALRDEESACHCIDVWCVDGPEDRSVVRALVSMEDSEKLLDYTVDQLGEETRVVVTSVEATLPRPGSIDENHEDGEGGEDGEDGEGEDAATEPWVFRRISREELYNDIAESAQITPNYFVLVALSAVVAGIGLLKDDVAVIIGAMVIAPLLGPNVALALSTTLGDTELAWRALKINAAGLGVSLVPALLLGLFLYPDDPGGQIAARTSASFLDLTVALAAGGAGALSFTFGVPAALVGVMVAVALLPPLVLTGMAAGAGQWHAAAGALLLTCVNVICINLAGVVAFLLQGVRPANWYKAAKAKKATRVALLFWVGTLAALAVLIYFTGPPEGTPGTE